MSLESTVKADVSAVVSDVNNTVLETKTFLEKVKALYISVPVSVKVSVGVIAAIAVVALEFLDHIF